MKKQLLILATALCLSLGAQAQTVYDETFTGTTVPAGWGANTSSTPPTYSALTANNKLIITMTDSNGPQQPVGASSPSKYDNFYYAVAVADTFNMAVGCKCITFDVDNTGNQEMTLFLQLGDKSQNVGGVYNHYTNTTAAVIAAGYVGPVTVNFSGKFFNYDYGTSSVGAYLDSMAIKSIDFQPVGHNAALKFKGNFTIDNFVLPTAPEINIKKGATSIISGGSSSLASVASGSTGTAEVFTIENTGTAALTITSITKAGANASEFTLGSIPTTVAAGSTATFTVTFAPTSVATGKTVTITINNNDSDEGTYNLVLTANGTAVATAVSAAQANISSSKLYPNPVSEMATVELNLQSSSDVKVILSDLLGKEVMTIATGTMSSLSESFSVANLNKGIYTVNYFINGSAAKAELLMVK